MGNPVVILDVWQVSTRHVPRAFFNMGFHRRTLRNTSGLRFWKLLGTGSGRTFTMRDADPHHWGLLTVWSSTSDHQQFQNSKVMRSWNKIALNHGSFELEPLRSKGTWAGQDPFASGQVVRWDGPTAALTRARIKVRWWIPFWKSVPPVSTDLHNTPGLITSLGIGEAPVGLQGTFSVWSNNDAITQFASRQAPHQHVVTRTHETNWYAEELFARFKVIRMSGNLFGLDLDAQLESNAHDQ